MALVQLELYWSAPSRGGTKPAIVSTSGNYRSLCTAAYNLCGLDQVTDVWMRDGESGSVVAFKSSDSFVVPGTARVRKGSSGRENKDSAVISEYKAAATRAY